MPPRLIPAPLQPADTQGLYDVLGIAKSASISEIKKAYMVLAKKVRGTPSSGDGRWRPTVHWLRLLPAAAC